MASDKLTIVIDAVFRGKSDVESAGREMKRLDEETRKASEGTRYFKEQVAKHLAMAGAAFAAVGVAAKIVYDQLKQGAALELARSQFENLATVVDTTADALLGKMREATAGMMSDAELIASASQIISLGLAKNEDDVTRLATVIGALGLDMQQVILTFANDSTMRLDALGLSVEGVTKKVEELKAGGFEGDAFDEAVLIMLEEKMTLLGDASQTTAGKLAIFEANIANVKDAGQLWLVEVLTPTVDALNTLVSVGQDAGGIIDDIIDAQIAEADSAEELIAIYDRLNKARGFGAFITGTSDDLAQNMEKVRKALLETTSSAEEYADAIVAMGIPGIDASQITGQVAESLRQTAIAEYEAAVGARVLKEAIEAQNRAVAQADSIMLGYQRSIRNATESATFSAAEWNSTVEEQQRQALMAARAMQRKADAMKADEDATRAAAESMLGWYNAALNADRATFSLVTSYTTVGGLTRDQRTNLDELTRAYERTQENIRSLTGGVAGLGLTEEELNAKLEEQYATLGQLSGAMEPLKSQTAQVTGVTQSWRGDIEKANAELYNMIAASGTQSPEALALLGVALGTISEDAANAALKSMLFTKGLDDIVTAALKGGPLTVEKIQDIQREMGILLDTIAETPDIIDIEYQTNAAEKQREIDAIRDAALAAQGVYSITFDIGQSGGVSGVPTVSGTPPPAFDYATGTGGQFMSVPGGFPNDSYTIGIQSGEDYMVRTPAERAAGVGMGGVTVTLSQNFYGQVTSTMAAMAAEQAETAVVRAARSMGKL